MRRFAFTLLELVFVIIIIGILAVLAMPNFRGNPLQTAAEQVASHIRYTQHLAMVDDKFDPADATWWRERWQIRFRRLTPETGYVIFSDTNQLGNSDNIEKAVDPLTGERIDGFLNYKVANLTTKYGITDVNSSCWQDDNTLVATNRGAIVFDNLGRPYRGVSDAITPFQYLLIQNCVITLVHPDGNATITVNPETGYVSVAY